MPQEQILVVDDEPTVVDTVRAYLEDDGFDVHTARDGQTALRVARDVEPDLVVLDVMLPGLDGLTVLRRLRRESNVYVLLLTARAEEADKLIGLELGADDYLTKPFSPRELVARVKAILRRGRGVDGEDAAMTFDGLRIEPEAHRVLKDSQPVDLTPTEYDLLCALARHAGRVLSREQLIEQVWGHDYYGDERVVDVHIGRVRKKIEDDPAEPQYVVTVRGAGYRFEGHPG